MGEFTQLSQCIEIISRRWPLVEAELSDVAVGDEVVVAGDGIQGNSYPSLVVNGINISSLYDPQKEAQLQLETVAESAAEVWVYGGGSPYQLDILLSRRELKKLTWVILSTRVFYQSLIFYDFYSVLQDPRLIIELATTQEKVHFPFSVQTPCLYLADKQAVRLRDMLQLELITPYLHEQQQKKYDDWVCHQVQQNIDLLQKDGDISELYSTVPGDVIVCAAGPTLSHWLQNYHPNKEDVIVAVDATLGALLSYRVVPKVVVSIDPGHSMSKLFAGDLSLLKNSWLAYAPEVYREVLLSWPGTRLSFYAGGGLIQEVVEAYPKSKLFSSGSVAHPAVDLAVKMGAKRVKLVGFDFSHVDNYTHAKEVAIHSVEENDDKRTVINGYGEQVPTILNLVHYLRDLESYIEKVQSIRNITFINHSRQGAEIIGAQYES